MLLACIAVGVLALILIVSIPSKRKLFIMGRDAGKTEITRQSIEHAAGASLDDIHEVKRYHVRTKVINKIADIATDGIQGVLRVSGGLIGSITDRLRSDDKTKGIDADAGKK